MGSARQSPITIPLPRAFSNASALWQGQVSNPQERGSEGVVLCAVGLVVVGGMISA